MTIEELTEKCAYRNVVLNEPMQEQLLKYAALLKEWNEKINLTAITELPEVIEKHFYDCLLPLGEEPLAGSVCDVGSGAGFPGLVLKIARPDLALTILEPTNKKCVFLKEAVAQLGLKDVEIRPERAEDYAINSREIFDVVSARAVAPLAVLAELCLPLVRINGRFLAMKGTQGMEEAEEAARAVQVLGAGKPVIHQESLSTGDTRINLWYPKVQKTPAGYPRPYAKIRKRPL
jgi:16S rRNA (guanine527-N7)-methyltransferase